MTTPFSPFGFPQMDPSQMDPRMMMELSQLIRELPPERINQMQSLMHNAMAGFDVRKEMEEFERSLPPGFREKMLTIVSKYGASMPQPNMGQPAREATVVPFSQNASSPQESGELPRDMHEARMTLLNAVASGQMSPEEAYPVLFPGEK